MLILLASAVFAAAEDQKSIEERLNGKLKNGLLVLRTPRVGEKIKFDIDGQSKNAEGIRGFDDKLQVTSVQLRDNKLIVRGVRLHDMYEPRTKKVSVASVNDPIELDLLLKNSTDATSISSDYYKVFLSSTELAQRSCSEIDYLIKMFEKATKDVNVLDVRDSKPQAKDSREVCLPSGSMGWLLGDAADVVLPHAIKDPDPDYPDLERVARKPGQAEFVIRVDEHGRITDGVLLRTDSLGFVRKSTQTFDRWKFTPGQKGGSVVPVVLRVEMNFHFMH
jgi:hypothetical protein